MRRRLKVLTVGCKANFADSASLLAEAVRAGLDVVRSDAAADVVVVNSCTVTRKADRDSRALARRARRENPRATIIMAGCYAGTAPDERERVPEADHWIGAGNPRSLAALLRALGAPRDGGGASLSDYAADLLLGHRRTFLKIQDGCDSRCAYCIVPAARGGNRSVDGETVLRRAVAAEGEGAREIVLTGIHVGTYGADRGERDGLARLTERILSATGRCRIRWSSIEPREIGDRLLDLLAGSVRLCPHLHVPLQSGSDGVLSRMRRPYTAAEYARTVSRAASRVRGLSVGADVIVGFPGESREDFESTIRLLGDVPVSYLHVFPYSPRSGTESARWRDDVPPGEKKGRVSVLKELDHAKRRAFAGSQVGRVLTVLAETSEPGKGVLSGTSENYLKVSFPGASGEVGDLVAVRALAADDARIAGGRP